MHKRALAVLAVLLCASVANAATSTLIVGDHLLLPNTAGQTIQIFVTGDAIVQGLNFTAVLGDGGSAVGGVDDVVPVLTADIITGTIFSLDLANASNLNSTHEFGVGLAAWTVTGSSVNTGFGPFNRLANGLLGTLTIDTTGFFAGYTIGLNLDSPDVAPTDFAGLPIEITNGSITIVPEPSALALGLFAAAGLAGFAARRRGRVNP